MAEEKWEKVEASPTWNFKEDKEFVGTYLGAETDVGPNKSNLYNFTKEDGSPIAVWGNSILDIRFKNLIPGQEVRIVYNGKVTSEKTKREYNSFDVFHKKGDAIEQALPTINVETPPGDDDFPPDDAGVVAY